MRIDAGKLLKGNIYPGRGIILGRSGDDSRAVMVYFIMGRSENSRNRVFERTADGIRTKARDPALMTDPSLVIYHPVRVLGRRTIVTNGDQTDTIREYLSSGCSFRDALLTREFEPDAPNYTPRISGLIEPDGSYTLSILKAASGDPACCLRIFYEYREPLPGLGHFISTYVNDGQPLPAFEGEPVPVSIPLAGGADGADGTDGAGGADGLEFFAGCVWESLESENKVALYARETVIATGESRDVIINKY